MPLDNPNSWRETPESRARKEGFEAAIKAFENAADKVLTVGIDESAVRFRNGVYQMAQAIREYQSP